MTARDIFASSVKSAESSKIAAVNTAETSRQESANASGVNVGYNLQTGNFANFNTAIKNANIAKINSLQSAEHAKQVGINAARDALRAAGDFGPA